MKYYKYHALGNDYFVIDPRETSLTLSKESIKLLCDRNYGIGSDGILWGPVQKENGDFELRIFNPDGSEAEKSGNGLRIFVRYLFDRGLIRHERFIIQTRGGRVSAIVYSKDKIEIDMGKPDFSIQGIPVSASNKSGEFVEQEIDTPWGAIRATAVSMGNPHCVITSENPTRELAEKIGPWLEMHYLFPNRTNVQFMQKVDDQKIRIEIWERGAGYTLASGSSSCAAASVAHKLGYVGRDVLVEMPGGVLQINILEDGMVRMTGPVTAVSTGELSEDTLSLLSGLPG